LSYIFRQTVESDIQLIEPAKIKKAAGESGGFVVLYPDFQNL